MSSISNLGGRESLEIAVTLRQSIELLIIEYQKGHTSYEERAHYLVFGGHRALVM